MYHTCTSLCSLCEGKEGQTQFSCHLFSLITGIKTNMLLIICLGLMAKLEFVSCDCDFGPLLLEDFDLSKVGIGVLTCIL